MLSQSAINDQEYWKRFRHNSFFIDPNIREAVKQGRADYTPISLSEIPSLFRSGSLNVDIALISVSPPDKHGYCSYGVSSAIVNAVTESARTVIAEVNEQMPRLLGACAIRASHMDMLVPSNRPIPELTPKPPDEVAHAVARRVATLVENGSTIQVGVGTIPNTVYQYLLDHQDLGIHTCVLADGIVPLVERGVVTNAKKQRHRGKVVTSFVIGSRDLYDFVDDNPVIECQPTEYVNDPFIISQINKMVSINTAFEVDLTGQVCSDSLGAAFYSGVGAVADFTIGAARSPGGKPIIAMRSTAKNETVSRIVPMLKHGAGVVTSRSDVRYVVTEYGVAYLHGKSMRERAMALIEVAHPKFRPWLLAEAKERNLVYADQIEPQVRMPVYPEELEQWLELKSGERVFMRPMKLSDEPLVREMFYQLSPESVRSRFMSSLTQLPHEKLQHYLQVDYASDMGLVVLRDKSTHADMIGMAHYGLDPKSGDADAAFLVRDEWQGKGIGTALVNTLFDSAVKNGIKVAVADVLSHNQGMMHVFQNAGYPIETNFEDNVYTLKIQLHRGRSDPNTATTATEEQAHA
jgi:acyl-CoA hydrolase